MARLEFAQRIDQDFLRIAEHLLAHQVVNPLQRIDEIVDACALLKAHPMIGRRVEAGLRELVIGHGAHGYVALYEFDARSDLVRVLAVRAQREAGYEDG